MNKLFYLDGIMLNTNVRKIQNACAIKCENNQSST